MSLRHPNDHTQPVYRNFHETVPIGESSFRVAVPRSYATIKLPNGETLHRRFRFTELNVTPGFFSQRALILGADGDGTVEPAEAELSLRLTLGFTCLDSLYFSERPDGNLVESNYDQGNRAVSLQNYVDAVNDHHENLIPEGFARSPAFLDWVDLNWYRTQGQPDAEQQETHDSEDQTMPLRIDPAQMVRFNCLTYYDVEEEDLDVRHFNSLPRSVRSLKGVNNYALPTTYNVENPEDLESIRVRIHLAPNVRLAFSSKLQLEALGFTEDQLGGRNPKKRFVFENVGVGTEYLIFTADNPPSFGGLAASSGRIYCKPTRLRHTFEDVSVRFPAGSFSENGRTLGAVQGALDAALKKAGLIFPRLKYDAVSTKFWFEHPPNDRLSLFVECDDRLAERLGYGPVARITRNLLSAAVRDGNSTVEAESLSKALVFDAGMCIVTLDEASSNDTYGVDDYSMTTLWPTSSGTSFQMSDKFSRPAYLPNLGGGGTHQHLIQMAFSLSTLKKNSTRVPLCLPISFTVEGTLEGTV